MTCLDTAEVSKVGRTHLGTIPGFTNYEEEEHYAFWKWRNCIETIFQKHGFAPFIPRPFEFAQHLIQKGGINKQIYGVARLHDNSLTDLGIPFDHTVPLALFVAPRIQKIVFPFKRYDTTYSFRGESPQMGRFRGFFQADVDIVDKKLDILADFECIYTIVDALKALEVGDFVVTLNHIAISKHIIASTGIPKESEEEVLRWIDKLDKHPIEEISKELSNLLPTIAIDSIENLIKKFTFRNTPYTFTLSNENDPQIEKAVKEIQDLYQLLINVGIDANKILFSPGMVRGLDYYTGIVFETHLIGKEKYGSIASGGRYSNLINNFSDNDTNIEGVGGSIGLTRLFDILCKNNEIPLNRKTPADVVVGFRTSGYQRVAIEIASILRQDGEKVDLYTTPGSKIGKQLEYANKKGIPSIILIMDNNAFVVRDLRTGKQEELKTMREAIAYWKKLDARSK